MIFRGRIHRIDEGCRCAHSADRLVDEMGERMDVSRLLRPDMDKRPPMVAQEIFCDGRQPGRRRRTGRGAGRDGADELGQPPEQRMHLAGPCRESMVGGGAGESSACSLSHRGGAWRRRLSLGVGRQNPERSADGRAPTRAIALDGEHRLRPIEMRHRTREAAEGEGRAGARGVTIDRFPDMPVHFGIDRGERLHLRREAGRGHRAGQHAQALALGRAPGRPLVVERRDNAAQVRMRPA